MGQLQSRVPHLFRVGVHGFVVTVLLLVTPSLLRAQPPQTAPDSSPAFDDTIEAGEGPFFTLRFGAALLYDVAAFAQDEASKQQLTPDADGKVRDFRFLLKGRLKFDRDVTWSAGIMYDGSND